MRLANGQIAGTLSSNEEMDDCRRDHLEWVSSYVQRAARRGKGVQRANVNVFWAVQNYALVYIDRNPQAFAYIECVKSTSDRLGAFGLAEKRRDTECFSSLGGEMRYVSLMSIDAVVGTLFVRERHVVL